MAKEKVEQVEILMEEPLTSKRVGRGAEFDTVWEHVSKKNQLEPCFSTSAQVYFPDLPPANVNNNYNDRICLHIVESLQWVLLTGHIRIMLGGNAKHLIATSSLPAITMSTPAGLKGIALELVSFRYNEDTRLNVPWNIDLDHDDENVLPISIQVDYFFKVKRSEEKNSRSTTEVHALCGSLFIEDVHTYQSMDSSCKTCIGEAAKLVIPMLTLQNDWTESSNRNSASDITSISSSVMFRAGSAPGPFPSPKNKVRSHNLFKFLSRKTSTGSIPKPLSSDIDTDSDLDAVLFEWKDGSVAYEDIAKSSKGQSYFRDGLAVL
ncbi:hypothetical protein BT96DRAFT_1005034 [Gymnopus androsaceus JB14]|uniref:Uncharacterized protein n=1 Tax=Gymnopus androsaceus JB14 TaxID=1447944 RepID=A0A6A4GP66_9AGAR|nr:hypothetical protein BT96DRAFT_1005034 [Gymnopus androsaceus JB14]